MNVQPGDHLLEIGGEAFCWAETEITNGVRCSEPVAHGGYVGEVEQ
jgi:hypothetical protein